MAEGMPTASDQVYTPRKPHGRRIRRDRWLSLWADRDGVAYVHSDDGVVVVPLTDDGCVLLAVERSPAFDREILGLVGGAAEAGEPLAETANRELQEELGWRAGRVDFLGELYPFKYLDTHMYAFLARDLTPNKLEGDEQYPVGTRKVPLQEWTQLRASGELHDATAIAALCLAERFLDGQEESVSKVDKFQEYALFVEDTARFTDRRQTVTNMYVAVNSILLTAVALLISNDRLQTWASALGAIPLLLGGAMICFFWDQLIRKYKQLVGLRMDELRVMEDDPAMEGCHKMYHAEDRLWPRDEQGKTIETKLHRAFSDLERWLPRVFLGLYVVFAIGVVVQLILS